MNPRACHRALAPPSFRLQNPRTVLERRAEAARAECGNAQFIQDTDGSYPVLDHTPLGGQPPARL